MWPDGAWGPKLDAALQVARRVAGMPDYAAQVAHLRRCHPERPVPTGREFYEDYVRARHEDGPTRCCKRATELRRGTRVVHLVIPSAVRDLARPSSNIG